MSFHTASFHAIGVANQVTVLDEAALAIALEIARTRLDELDKACSRFRDDSELARLNAVGYAVVSPLLLDAVETALAAAEITGGLVDPTVGASLRALGYDRDFVSVVRTGGKPVCEPMPAPGRQSVLVDRPMSTVRLHPGTELDLGATAKAFAADVIADAAHVETGSPVLVSLGGDIAVAGSAPEGGWPVLVTDDSRARDAHGQTVAIREGGLATSSTTVRRWRAGSVDVHHIVDPRTGAPVVGEWRTVTVAASTCVEANVAATAAIVLGSAAPAWLESRDLSARLVRPDGTIAVTGMWPAEVAV